MHLLENVYIASDRNFQDFRFPVQLVNRPHLDFRGFCGTVSSGTIRKGEEVMILPSKKTTKVKSIVTMDGELEEAYPPLSVTLTLEDEVEVSRGSMIVRPGNQPIIGDKFDAMVVWMDEEPMLPGNRYFIKHTSQNVPGTISTLRYKVDVITMHREETPTLKLNEIGRCSISLNQPICFDAYSKNRTTGAFIIIDRMSNSTVGAGMIVDRGQPGKSNLWDDESETETVATKPGSVTPEERSARFGQKPCTLLLTGLAGAGKTTISQMLERRLFSEGRACGVLDGQHLRSGISKDLGFTAEERSENLRRGAEIAKLMNESGLICISAFVAPSEDVRQKVAAAIGEDHFFVIHLAAPVEVCRERDDTGLYEKADSGEIANFPGVSFEYEVPTNPDLVLPTHELAAEQCVDQIVELLRSKKMID